MEERREGDPHFLASFPFFWGSSPPFLGSIPPFFCLHPPFLGRIPPFFGIHPSRRCRSRAALAGWSGTERGPNPARPPGDALGGFAPGCPPPLGALPSPSAARSPNKGGGGGDAGLPRLLPAPAPAAAALPSPRSPSSPGKSEVSCWARAKLGGAASSSLLGIYRRERLGKGPRHLLFLLLLLPLLLLLSPAFLHPPSPRASAARRAPTPPSPHPSPLDFGGCHRARGGLGHPREPRLSPVPCELQGTAMPLGTPRSARLR